MGNFRCRPTPDLRKIRLSQVSGPVVLRRRALAILGGVAVVVLLFGSLTVLVRHANELPEEALRELESRERVECWSKMARDLTEAAPWMSSEAHQDANALREYDGAKEGIKSCVDQKVDSFLSEFREACARHKCGERVMGGCPHLARGQPTGAGYRYFLQTCAS